MQFFIIIPHFKVSYFPVHCLILNEIPVTSSKEPTRECNAKAVCSAGSSSISPMQNDAICNALGLAKDVSQVKAIFADAQLTAEMWSHYG